MKRVFDFTLSLLALIILSPLFIIVALIIKLTDNGPVFLLKIGLVSLVLNLKFLNFGQ